MLEALFGESLPSQALMSELRRAARGGRADQTGVEVAVRGLEQSIAANKRTMRELSAEVNKWGRYAGDVRRFAPVASTPQVRTLLRSSLTLFIERIEGLERDAKQEHSAGLAADTKLRAHARRLPFVLSRRLLQAVSSNSRARIRFLATLQKRREELVIARTLVSPAKRGPIGHAHPPTGDCQIKSLLRQINAPSLKFCHRKFATRCDRAAHRRRLRHGSATCAARQESPQPLGRPV